jgi:PAS domain S-box-containing protein
MNPVIKASRHAGYNIWKNRSNNSAQAQPLLHNQGDSQPAYTGREQLLDLAITTTPIILFIINPEGIIEYVSGKKAETLRRRYHEIDGKSIFNVFQDNEDIIDHFERALSGKRFSRRVEIGPMTFNGHYAPLQDDQGNVTGVISVFTELTEQRKAEEALQESEARFQAIFEDTAVGILIKDAQGRLIQSNPAFQRMLGYTADELAEINYIDLIHPFDRKASQQKLNDLVAGQIDHYQLNKRYICKDKQVVWASLTASPIHDADGQVRLIVSVIEDITANKLIEEELAEVQRRLAQGREDERRRLSQDLHDGPLQDLIGLVYRVQALQDVQPEAPEVGELDSIQGTLREVVNTIRSICGELRPPALAPFGLEKAIRSHAEEFQNMYPEFNISLNLYQDRQSLSEELRLMLYRVYQEALNNILRHSKAKKIWVRFLVDSDQVVLEVQDDGVGFEMPRRWVELARQGHLGIVGLIERVEARRGR